MAEGTALNPTDYIQHHLTFLAKPVGEAVRSGRCTGTRC